MGIDRGPAALGRLAPLALAHAGEEALLADREALEQGGEALRVVHALALALPGQAEWDGEQQRAAGLEDLQEFLEQDAVARLARAAAVGLEAAVLDGGHGRDSVEGALRDVLLQEVAAQEREIRMREAVIAQVGADDRVAHAGELERERAVAAAEVEDLG